MLEIGTNLRDVFIALFGVVNIMAGYHMAKLRRGRSRGKGRRV